MSQIAIVIDEESGEIRIDFSEVKGMFEEKIADNFEEGKKELSEFANAMQAIGISGNVEYQKMCQEIISENDELAEAIYSAGRNMIVGTEEKDSLHSNSANAIIIGGAGDDEIKAHGTDVIIIGGKGNDKLYGSRGDDANYYGEYDGTEKVTYVWNMGDGNDTIKNASNIERAKETLGKAYLRMGSGITLENLKFIRNNSENAYIRNMETGEELTIENWFKDNVFKLDGIIFADGSVLNKEDLIEKVAQFETTDGNDALVGNSNNDTLNGGAGDDYLEGGYGDDTYIWGKGYGNDTINNVIQNWAKRAVDSENDTLEFTAEVSCSDVLWRSDNDDMLATLVDTGEVLRIKDWNKGENCRIDEIMFGDGEIFSADEVDNCVKAFENNSIDVNVSQNSQSGIILKKNI